MKYSITIHEYIKGLATFLDDNQYTWWPLKELRILIFYDDRKELDPLFTKFNLTPSDYPETIVKK